MRRHRTRNGQPDSSPGNRSAAAIRRTTATLAAVATLLFTATLTRAQDTLQRTLIDERHYDVVTLTDAYQGASFKVLPLPFRTWRPLEANENTSIRIRLYEDDEKQYEVDQGDIAKIEFFEQLVLREAEQLTKRGEFAAAYRNFSWLIEEGAEIPRLDLAFHRMLYLEARQLLQQDRPRDALIVLESLHDRAPEFRPGENSPAVKGLFDELAQSLGDSYLDRPDYAGARSLASRLRGRFRDNSPPAVERLEDRLQGLAGGKLAAARSALAEEDFRRARRLLRETLAIAPATPGAADLVSELTEKYPAVLVGVSQPWVASAARAPFGDWASRRVRPLVANPLVRFLGVGSEGGRYDFPLGLLEQSDDLRSLILRINRDRLPHWTAYEISDRLAGLAESENPEFRPAWGGLLAAVSLPSLEQVRAKLSRPHVLPQAWLCTTLLPLDDSLFEEPSPAPGRGPFFLAERNADEVMLLARSQNAPIAEIAERRFSNATRALNALRRGEVDVVDRLYPADAVGLLEDRARDKQLQVEPYLLPSLQMLLINEENLFLAAPDFRRALVYGLDREQILQSELLNGELPDGFGILSGPFPFGKDERDPLAYAYDHRIEPRRFTPLLARLLAKLARDRLESEDAVWQPLRIGYPPHEAAQIACGAIARQWQAMGVETELQEVSGPAGNPVENGVDLLFTEIVMREPLVDAHRLLGDRGLAPTSNAMVRHALRQLESADSWTDVRAALLKVHATVHDEVAIIPLWQMIDYFAYRPVLEEVGEQPVSLYEHIDQWRLSAGSFAP